MKDVLIDTEWIQSFVDFLRFVVEVVISFRSLV